MPAKKKKMIKPLPLLPLKDVIVFPGMVLPLLVGREVSLAAVEECLASDCPIFLCMQRDIEVDVPELQDLYDTGVVANILQTLRMPDGTLKIVVEGLMRATINVMATYRGFLEVEIAKIPIENPDDKNTTALVRTIIDQFEEFAKLSQRVAPEVVMSIRAITGSDSVSDLISAYLPVPVEERQEILEIHEVTSRLEKITGILHRELDLLEIERQVREKVRDQMERGQREYYLHEQLKAIHKELGNREDYVDEYEDLRLNIKKAKMPKEAKEKADREIVRYERMPPMSPESSIVRTYLEWLVEMPWQKRTKDTIDLELAAQILDEDHYGLTKVKERILEFLAVRKLAGATRGPVLCLVGPPGVGKTSLGQSIARAMKRKFIRISLGGVRDEAEIRGHRRTYIGAMPGRIIQSIKKIGVKNPVFMLDELDKMTNDFRGDPSSALLEVLDPEQNNKFSDHYLEVEFNLRSVFFIATANSEYEIPHALHDRMEIVRLSGYTSHEKENIAKLFLAPKQIKANGLNDTNIHFAESGIIKIIQRYTREAGVRELERQIASICRKIARKVVSKKKQQRAVINEKAVVKLLGPEKYSDIRADEKPQIGVVTGLAWTEVGGDILNIETSLMKGKGELVLTGQLGEVMQESAKAAYTYIRAHAVALKVPSEFYRNRDVHIHVPEGAIPKDGPSAGVAMAVSLLSALKKKAPNSFMAMTGEITLRGRILPVGGIKEKILAAHRAGIRRILLPKENEKDLVEIPKEVKNDIQIDLIEDVGDVFKMAFGRVKRKKNSK